MLSKSKYPWMNRKMRRHPERELKSAGLGKGWLGGGNFLLAGLLIRGGYNVAPTGDSEGAVV